MNHQLKFLGKLFLIWLIYFTFQRLLFFLHFAGDFSGHYGEAFLTPFYGLQLDISAFSYIMGLPFLVSCAGFFVKDGKGLRIMNKCLVVFLMIVFVWTALIMAGEIVTYTEWKTKLSTKIFLHLKNPSEVFRTASTANTLWFFFYVLIQMGMAYFLVFRWFKTVRFKSLGLTKRAKLIGFPSYLIGGTFIFIMGFRGGLQQIPVSSTDAYFSNEQIVNDLSVNCVWNFLHVSYLHWNGDLDKYFNNVDPVEAKKIVEEEYYVPSDSKPIDILKTDRPNIILVSLEGWSSQMIGPLGGPEDITPRFNKRCKEGLFFTKIYSTGGTSETGHSAIISGYPTISGISISTESAKCRQLPSLAKSVEEVGYNTFYMFGGSLSYGNIGGYLADVGFDRLVDENDLDLGAYGKLGYHDEVTFPYFLDEVQDAKRPYFYGIFTQSTHPPYDMPVEPFDGHGGDPFVTSMNYADEHLEKFLKGIEKLPDYDNTLVIMISDHSRTNIFNKKIDHEDFFHIPMLFWGGALKDEYRGQEMDILGSQADLAKTLLHQMNLNSTDYKWSKDLLNPETKEWAISTSTVSYGWTDSLGHTVYRMLDKRLVHSPYEDERRDIAIKKCRAIMESMYREYKEM